MKKYIYVLSSFLLFFILSLTLCAQPPQKMSYQAVVRNAQNSLITNQNIGVRISIVSHNTQLAV
ncbi:MAG TPA: hypothetical protein PLL08_06805, partial [Bacteroidales bacterium]|nr:hypothetical protein [Bacteroidales bacterium]